MKIDRIPFSVSGSYFTIMKQPGNKLKLHSVSGFARQRDIVSISLVHDGAALAPEADLDGMILTLSTPQGMVEVCFESTDCLRLRGKGVSLRLDSAYPIEMGCCVQMRPGRWRIPMIENRLNVVVESLRGTLDVDAPWGGAHINRFSVTASGGESGYEIALELRRESCPAEGGHGVPFEQCAAAFEQQFRQYLKKTVSVSSEFAVARREAAYLNWSSIVSPHGLLKRPAMFMSKNWMCNVWSWDHCFNAIALSTGDPALAWDQFMVLFDAQDGAGALPDSANDCEAVFTFCKPPVHGWTLKKMMDRNGFFTAERVREAYGPLCRWTDWWFQSRDSDGDGMPEYHHGNDSGWDNGTVFSRGVPLESPDLAALLIVQMDVLSSLASRLGNFEDATRWKQRADALLEGFLQHFVTADGGVTAKLAGTHEAVECDCLLSYVSLILGDRLPKALRTSLVRKLRDSGLITEYGLATEAPQSPLYNPNGYWRGPIWAPSTMLVTEGLRTCGEAELAGDIVLRFLKMCAGQGFAENFDALTGASLCDPAYTWTSSVFLMLGNEYLN